MRWAQGLAAACTVAACLTFLNMPCKAQGIRSDASKMNKQWIGIVYGPWRPSVVPLMNYRQSQGRSACIWTLPDLDADYGGHGPSQVRSALQEAWQTWTTKPKWVVLFADHEAGVASTTTEIGDFAIADGELGQPDGYRRGLWPLMEVNGDSIPEIAVGRVAATDSNFIHNYVSKVIQHDTDVNDRSGYTGSVMLVDNADDSSNDPVWLQQLADSLYANWDGSPQKQLLHYADYPAGGYAQRVAGNGAWNTGPGMVLAMGTSSNWWTVVSFWWACAASNPWRVTELGATGRYPALLDLSCDINATDHVDPTTCDTYYHYVPVTKQLIGGDPFRGASVVIGPMRATIPYWDFLIGKHLLLRKAAGDYTWGEVFTHGLSDAIAEDAGVWDHAYEYTLEGDPAAQAVRGGVTAVPIGPGDVEAAALRRPYPNPTAIGATLEYALARSDRVSLRICDVAGRVVRTLQNGPQGIGHFTRTWDLRSDAGTVVHSGVFFAQLRVGAREFRERVVVVR